MYRNPDVGYTCLIEDPDGDNVESPWSSSWAEPPVGQAFFSEAEPGT